MTFRLVDPTELQELQDAKRQRDILLAVVTAMMVKPSPGKLKYVIFTHDHLERFSGMYLNIESDERIVKISLEGSPSDKQG